MSLFKKSQDSNNSKMRNRKFRIPIALHFYAAFTIIILFFFTSTYLISNQINMSQIKNECTRRIDNAINSCQSFSDAFKESAAISENMNNPELFRDDLLKKIASSTEISNDASIVLFYENQSYQDVIYNVVWPSPSYSYSSNQRGYEVLNKIVESDGINTNKTVKDIDISGSTFYYRFVNLHYDSKNEEDQVMTDEYYILIFIDSSNYRTYAEYLNTNLFNTMVIAIVFAGILSIIASFPIISSTRRLSRFARRISKGDFNPNKGRIVSRELYDLSETMNQMANKLNESDKEQKTFFQNASHELRTPLMSIQGYAEGIKYGVFDQEHQIEAVDIIISETNRLSEMVENLLSISKMDLSASNNYEVKKSIINVYELLGVAIDKVRGGFLLSDKELINNIMINDSVHILANENDIFRMLENVFSNCLRYASKKVFFNCYKQNDNIVFEISDDGPGISEEVMSHLFDRFAKGQDGKHGIGLALVKAIAKEHNGSIEAGNKPEGGAIFKISIPTISANTQLTRLNK